MNRSWRAFFRFFVVVLLSSSAALPGGAQDLRRGQIIEKVSCRSDAAQTYALYLPSGYAADKKWPILYALDAGARGKLPVERFKEAAEKYGYILAGSNNSQNGPVKIVEDALHALLTDTQTRLSVDPQRIYVAGFSGGARAAIGVGLAMKERIAGILAFGAGSQTDLQSVTSIPFTVYLAAGYEDFNYVELSKLNRKLDGLHVVHAFETFPGGHEWPPEPVCMHAIEWLELEAAKSGSRILDPAVVVELDSRLKQSQETEDARRWRLIEKDVEARQAASDRELSGLCEDFFAGRERLFAAQKLQASFQRLESDADQKKDEVRRIAARRVLTRFWIALNEETLLAFGQQEYISAALRLEVMAQIQPDNPKVYYHLARAHCLSGRRKKAIESLREAVAKGFKDIDMLESDPDLEPLRQTPDYRKIIADLTQR